ncbi:TIGR03773 family transporter-associated surface protein [Staphylococcus chromogenes]|nr:TIGR03773 family transporter-associated surface protein [Staphylococcus chromogenes]
MSLPRASVLVTVFAVISLLTGWTFVASPSASAASCNELVPLIKDDRSSPAEWVDPASISFTLGDAARTDLPQALGPIPAGEAYLIGATQVANVPWLGVNTMHPDLLANTTGDVTWELTGFDGPGSMYVFTQGNMGQVVGKEWFEASNGSGSGSTVVARNSHVHPNWVFSEPGTYNVELTQTAELTSGESVSGTATITFEVGNGGGGATEGHFDFGAMIGCAGDTGGTSVSADDSFATTGTESGTRTNNTADSEGQSLQSASQGFAPAAEKSGTTGKSANATAASNSGTTSQSTSAKSLPNTGSTVLTFPIAFLALGVLILGGGLVFAARHFRFF